MREHWIAYMGYSVALVENCESRSQAVWELLTRFDLENKPYLAKEWNVRPATPDEVRLYAAQADGQRPSQPTARVVKQPRKSTQERLL
jgi:hypothetical protein